MSHLIDLAHPRKIVVRQGAHQYAFLVNPIPEQVWFKYFDGIVSSAERRGNEVVQRVDASSAGVELAESAIVGEYVAGEYLALSADALGSIPLAQRLAVAGVLTSAFSPDEQQPGDEEYHSEVVRLHAIWSAADSGAMRRHKNLLHFFDTPTAEQNRRYRRDDSRAQVIGGSRRGTTIYHGAQKTLAALYDELILRVEGYTWEGREMDKRLAAIHMDSYHKVSAVVKLFAPAEVDIEEDEE